MPSSDPQISEARIPIMMAFFGAEELEAAAGPGRWLGGASGERAKVVRVLDDASVAS